MRIIRAEAMGFCFGVRDALAVTDAVNQPELVTIHGELVHNAGVLAGFAERGFRMAGENDRRELPATPTVLITAHGVSETTSECTDRGRQTIDRYGACRCVLGVHRTARTLAAEGRHVLVIGRPGHVEVLGIVRGILPTSTW